MTRPSISLLVPCYNAEPYILALLDRAQTQTSPYYEIICFDDASTDRTAELLKGANVKLISDSRNHGPAYARQQLLAAAAGDFVHFHDADDLLSDRFVEGISPLLNVETAGVCARKEVDKGGFEKIASLAGADFSDSVELVTRNFIHFNQVVFPTALAKKHMQLASDLRILEDRLAFLSMAAEGLKFRYIDECLTTFVKRSNSLTASQSHPDGMDCLYVYWKRAQPLVGDRGQALADYVSYTAWCYYYEDAAVFPQLKRIMRSIRKAGFSPLQNASRSEQRLGRILSPEKIYWLRRKRARVRTQ